MFTFTQGELYVFCLVANIVLMVKVGINKCVIKSFDPKPMYVFVIDFQLHLNYILSTF